MLTEKEALDHCNRTFNQVPPQDGKLYCEAIFDGVLCWNHTLAGKTAYGGCPVHHPASDIFSSKGYSFKECTLNGTWYTFPGTDKTWTNYTPCASDHDLEKPHVVVYVYILGYSISLLCTLLSIVIFQCLHNQLKCTRICLHRHLFVSYILTGASWVAYYSGAVLNTTILIENPLWCRLLHVFTQYATMSNYAWMFAEGVYLHTSLVFAFSNVRRLYVLCVIQGWVLPIAFVAVYVSVRATTQTKEADLFCWIGQQPCIWVLVTPIILSMALNVFFLLNVLRIFVSKLRSNTHTNGEAKIRQTIRACLILVPLLGIQFVMFPFRPHGDVFAYDCTVAVFTSFQGTFVAIVFCFINGEVTSHCRRRIRDSLISGVDISNFSIRRTSFRRLSQSLFIKHGSSQDRPAPNHERQIDREEPLLSCDPIPVSVVGNPTVSLTKEKGDHYPFPSTEL